MKRLLISFASKGREDYNAAQRRNIDEAKKYFNGDFLYYSLDSDILEHNGVVIRKGLPRGCPSHKEVPYAFKPYLFKEAYDLGYRQILWLDSTVCVTNDIGSIFNKMNKDGVVAFHNLGHPLEKWISDIAAKNTGIDLSENPYQIMACVMGFDLDHPVGFEVFKDWFSLCNDGQSFQNNDSNRAGFITHRHDQACLSALLWHENMKLLPYGNLVYEAHSSGFQGRKIYFINKGI